MEGIHIYHSIYSWGTVEQKPRLGDVQVHVRLCTAAGKLIAELQRAKRASEAPWVRKIGNPSSRENLVMTSAYERPYVRPYKLGGRGRGVSRSPIRETKECHLSSAVFCLEKS